MSTENPSTAQLRIVAAACCLTLASCGGGSDNASTPASSATPASTSTTSSTAAPGAAYTAGSPQASALQALNAARAQCGFGTLAQSAELDTSAAAHASYMALNNAYSHSEVAGRPGFTGTLSSDRETAAGYRWIFAGEVLAQVSNGSSGADAVRLLLAAPYHAALLLDAFHDVGFGWSTVSGFPTLTGDLGVRAGQGGVARGALVTYPCNGITDAIAVGANEEPSPFPSNTSARWGQPVIVRGPSDLAINSASITGPLGSVQVLAIYGPGQAADPNNTGDFTQGTFSIIPAPLQPNTTYTVGIAYTSGGTAGRRDFSFATGAR